MPRACSEGLARSWQAAPVVCEPSGALVEITVRIRAQLGGDVVVAVERNRRLGNGERRTRTISNRRQGRYCSGRVLPPARQHRHFPPRVLRA